MNTGTTRTHVQIKRNNWRARSGCTEKQLGNANDFCLHGLVRRTVCKTTMLECSKHEAGQVKLRDKDLFNSRTNSRLATAICHDKCSFSVQFDQKPLRRQNGTAVWAGANILTFKSSRRLRQCIQTYNPIAPKCHRRLNLQADIYIYIIYIYIYIINVTSRDCIAHS